MDSISIRVATDASDSTFLISCIDKVLPWLESIGCEGQWGTEPWSENVAFCEAVKGFVEDPSKDLAKGMAWIADVMVGEQVVPAGIIVMSNHPPSYAAQPSLDPVPEIYIRLLITNRTLGDISKGVGVKLIDCARAVAKREGVNLLRLDTWKGGDGVLRRYTSTLMTLWDFELILATRYYERQGFTCTRDIQTQDLYRPDQVYTGWLLEQWLR